MKIKDLKYAIIPAIAEYAGAPIIQADQNGPTPKGSHATYKLTTPYGKAVGQAEETTFVEDDVVKIRRVDDYKTTISFTAYDFDDDVSLELAQKIYDWFAFAGLDKLQQIGVAVVEQFDIINRDAFVINEYERRNGFDVILRVPRELIKEIDWFEKANIQGGVMNE